MKNFSYRACAIACTTEILGMTVIGLQQSHTKHAASSNGLLLYIGMTLVMLVTGFGVGRISKHMGCFEIIIATLIAFVLLGVHLAFDIRQLLAHGLHRHYAYDAWLGPVTLGRRVFGPMWDRLLYLAGPIAAIIAMFGSSCACLLYADGHAGIWGDTGFAMPWFVAKRYLWGVRADAWRVSQATLVAILGVALGVATLLTVTAVMSGYQEDIQHKILSTNAHIVLQKYGIDFKEYPQIMQKAAGVTGVLASAPFVFNEAMLGTATDGIGILLKGIEPSLAGHVTDIAANLCSIQADGKTCLPHAVDESHLETLLTPHNHVPSMLIGLTLFLRLGLPIGSHVYLTTPVGIAGAHGNAPKRMAFRIGGIFHSGMHEFDARLIYTDLKSAQRLLGLNQTVSGIEFKVAKPQDVAVIARNILSAVGRYPYHTLDWHELNTGIFTALMLQKVVMFLVLTCIVIVASFNIASTLFMAVVEKSREIAVLKSMGASDMGIMKIFMLQGWVTGLLGVLLGVVFGLSMTYILGTMHIGIAADVYMVNALKVRVQPLEVLLVIAAALLISHLATIYPALRAARQRPIDTIRND